MAALPLLLALGFAGLALVVGGGSKKPPKEPNLPPGAKPGEKFISPQEMAMLDRASDGSLRYKAEARPLLVFALNTKQAVATDLPTVFRMLEWFDFNRVPAGQRAYERAKSLHAQGMDVWVTPTLMPQNEAVAMAEKQLIATKAGQSPPFASFVALLVPASAPWPDEAPINAPGGACIDGGMPLAQRAEAARILAQETNPAVLDTIALSSEAIFPLFAACLRQKAAQIRGQA